MVTPSGGVRPRAAAQWAQWHQVYTSTHGPDSWRGGGLTSVQVRQLNPSGSRTTQALNLTHLSPGIGVHPDALHSVVFGSLCRADRTHDSDMISAAVSDEVWVEVTTPLHNPCRCHLVCMIVASKKGHSCRASSTLGPRGRRTVGTATILDGSGQPRGGRDQFAQRRTTREIEWRPPLMHE